jgi:DNA-binding transcriptional LysR family regulator
LGVLGRCPLYLGGVDYVPNVVRQFTDKYPNVRFSFSQNSSTELETKLIKGELDLILTPRASSEAGQGMRWSLVDEQELILIFPQSHPLASAIVVGSHPFYFKFA